MSDQPLTIPKPLHEWLPSPNITIVTGRVRNAIVYHHTGGALWPSINWLRNPVSKVSTHYLVAKSGKVYQLVSDDHIAYHAGYSRMPDGREDVNRYSIGIEIENDGDGKDPYPQAQINALVALGKYLVAKYAIPRQNNVTHELVRRLWKQKYPSRRDDQGRAVSFKNDPAGLDMNKLLDRVYAPPTLTDLEPRLLHVDAFDELKDIRWNTEEAVREAEAGKVQEALSRLTGHVIPLLYRLESMEAPP